MSSGKELIGQWIYNFEMFDINTRFVKCNGADFMCFRPQYTLVQFFLSQAFWFDFKSRWKTREGHPGMRDWHSREGGSCLVLVVETTTTTGTAFPVTTATLVKRLSLSSRNYNTLTWKTGSGNSIVLVVKTTTTTTSPVTRTPWPERLDHSGKAVELSSRLIRFNRWLLPINSDLVLTVDCLGKRLTKIKKKHYLHKMKIWGPSAVSDHCSSSALTSDSGLWLFPKKTRYSIRQKKTPQEFMGSAM